MRWPGKWRTLTLKLWRETRGPDIEQNGWQPPQRWSEQKAVKTTTTEQKMFHTALENAREAAAPFCVDFSFCVRRVGGSDPRQRARGLWGELLSVVFLSSSSSCSVDCSVVAPRVAVCSFGAAYCILPRIGRSVSVVFFLLLAKRCYSHPSAPEEKFTLNKLGLRFCLKI